jgi:hypothetical protein
VIRIAIKWGRAANSLDVLVQSKAGIPMSGNKMMWHAPARVAVLRIVALILAIAALRPETHWRVTDARLALEAVDHRAGMTRVQKQKLTDRVPPPRLRLLRGRSGLYA